MVDDLTDLREELKALQRRVDQLDAGIPFERSSITNGRLRVGDGELRVDEDGLFTLEGRFEQVGVYELLNGGNFNVRSGGNVNVHDGGGVNVKGGGDIAIEDGGDLTVRDQGKITVQGGGDVEVQDGGDLTVATGGQIQVNGPEPIRLRHFGGIGAMIQFGSTGNLKGLYATDGTIFLNGQGGIIGVDEVGVSVQIPSLPSSMGARYVVLGDDGYLYTAASGGPGGGPGTPGTPGDNPGGYIYPVDPGAWTLGDDFAAHVARGSAEPGIDWWTSIGTPIWAPGDGTITDVQTSYAGATGSYVTLVTDEGDWFRFLHLSSTNVSVNQTVSQGDILAYSGGSGFGSPSGYGPHIHVSFAVGYTGNFPGAGGLDDFIAYMA